MNEPIGGDLVQRGGQVRQVRVVGDPPRHADDAEPVLDQERHVEADEQGPEVPLARAVLSSIFPVNLGHQK